MGRREETEAQVEYGPHADDICIYISQLNLLLLQLISTQSLMRRFFQPFLPHLFLVCCILDTLNLGIGLGVMVQLLWTLEIDYY